MARVPVLKLELGFAQASFLWEVCSANPSSWLSKYPYANGLQVTTFALSLPAWGPGGVEPGQAEGQSTLPWGGWDSPCPLRALLLPLPTDTKLPLPSQPKTRSTSCLEFSGIVPDPLLRKTSTQ